MKKQRPINLHGIKMQIIQILMYILHPLWCCIKGFFETSVQADELETKHGFSTTCCLGYNCRNYDGALLFSICITFLVGIALLPQCLLTQPIDLGPWTTMPPDQVPIPGAANFLTTLVIEENLYEFNGYGKDCKNVILYDISKAARGPNWPIV